MANNNAGKDRGLFLSILVALGALGTLTSLTSNIGLKSGIGVEPLWLVSFGALAALLQLLALWGIWKLKRWGVYLYFVLVISNLVLQALFSNVIKQSGGTNILLVLVVQTAIISALWVWAIRRKWPLFT